MTTVVRMREQRVFFWILGYAGISVFWWVLWRSHPQITAENHVMENFQVGCLLVGILFLVGTLRSTADVASRVFFLGLILLYFTVVVLEVDTRKMDAPRWLVFVTNGTVRDLWLGSLWIIAALIFVRGKPYQILSRFHAWLSTAAGRLLLGSGVLWTVALIAEKQFYVSAFVEEWLECHAGLLMAQSAWLMFLLARARGSSGRITGRDR